MTVSTLSHINHSYRDGSEATVLNTIDVWLPEINHDGSNPNGNWVIFIHGGAWRDPLIDSTSFKRTVDILATNTTAVGFASINYRLSPYPDHYSEPSSPIDPSRNAKHPDHLSDVTRALIFLEKTYRISGRYLLAGHSCGATLAFQIPEKYGAQRLPQPFCIIGSEGIYNLPSLLEAHQGSSYYRQFIVSAFGNSEDVWAEVSPAVTRSSAIWEKTNVLLISHSNDDEYVEKEQSLGMLDHISNVKRGRGHSAYIPVTGKHDEIHEVGKELARIIIQGLESV